MATSEDPAFAAISKQPFSRLLQSIKLAPQSKSRRTIAAWPCPQAMCNALSPSVSWRSREALKSSRILTHCRLFFLTDHIKAVRELLSLLSTSAPNLRSVSQAFLWKKKTVLVTQYWTYKIFKWLEPSCLRVSYNFFSLRALFLGIFTHVLPLIFDVSNKEYLAQVPNFYIAFNFEL